MRDWEWLRKQIDRLLQSLEKSIIDLYKRALAEIQGILGKYFAKFAKNETLTLQEMREKKRLNAMLEEFKEVIDTLTERKEHDIIAALESVYAESFYMTSFLVQQQVTDIKLSYRLINPHVIKRAVMMSIDKLTLPQRLQEHRAQVLARLRKEINLGLLKGEGYSKIVNRLKAVLEGDAKKARATARTESARVQNRASADSYDEAVAMGVELEVVWVSTLDLRTRRTHQKMDGKKVKHGEDFTLPGGFKAKRPHDPRLPAKEVVNCRCTTIVVVSGVSPMLQRRARDYGDATYQARIAARMDTLMMQGYTAKQAQKIAEKEIQPPNKVIKYKNFEEWKSGLRAS